MADNEQLSDGLGGTVTVSMDEASSGQVQRVKLAYSADGSDTHVAADASGLLVTLGANNDVTLTSGTVTAVSGTVTTSIAGTPTVNLADSTATISGALGYGTDFLGYVGISTSGSAIADTLELTSGTAVAVGIVDSEGDQLTFATAEEISVTPTIDTSAYAAGDNLDGTILSFSNAAAEAAGSGWLTKLIILDKDAEGADMQVFFLNASITPPSENAAFSLSDSDAENITAVVDTANGTWYGYGGGSACHIVIGPPIPYKLSSGTTLYAVVRVNDAVTYTSSADLIFKAHVLRD